MADGTTVTKQKNWFVRHKVLTGVLVIIVIAVAASSGNNSKNNTSKTIKSTTTTKAQTAATKSAAAPATRQVKGKVATLGAGSFIGGQDVAAGLYDVTPGAGQSGNFVINDGESVNEVLSVADGLGVTKVRTSIASGDKIKISGLSQVVFTPVTTQFVTAHANVVLYAGTFTVGQDIGVGKYVVTPGSGESGNFIVNDGEKSNEVLGSSDGLGVPNVTITLDKGDSIKLSGMSTVNFSAQ